MARPWKHFLYVQVPLAALILAVAAQVLAIIFSNVPRWLTRPDELAMAVSSDPQNYRVLLLGDSKTSRATPRFALGPPSEVANLSTNMFVAVTGSLFLVERYLETHPAPEHVVLAVSPQLYHFANNERRSRYFLWYTYNRPAERNFLRTYHPGMGQRDLLPAILDLQEQVLEPIMSLLKRGYAALRKRGPLSVPKGWIIPDAETRVLHSANIEGRADRFGAEDRDLRLAGVSAAALARLCELSRNRGFQIDFVWPPMPESEHKILDEGGALAALERDIRSIMEGRCRLGAFADFNERRTYRSSSFQHDLLHLFGDGWEQRYSSDLREYISGLLHKKTSYTAR